jgi:Flp pilus assembly protein TadG
MKKENGQAMVEFALVLPILLLFFAGIIDFGWIFHNQLVANNASREAARYVAIHYYVDLNNDDAARVKSNEIIVDYVGSSFSGVNVTITKSPDDTITGEKIKVYFTGNVKVLTPLLDTVLGSDVFPLKAECTMRIER